MTAAEDPALPTFDAAQLAAIAPFGEERDVPAGEVLYRAGDSPEDPSCARPSFFVVLAGEVEVIRPDPAGDVLIAIQGPGRFLGELNLLTGQRPYFTARMRGAGRVLVLPPQEFHRLMSSKTDLATIIFTALTARREQLRHGEAALGLTIVGSRYSPEAMALRGFVTRSQVPHTWVDVDDVADPDALLAGLGLGAGDLPAVQTSTTTLRRTTPGELGEHLGLTFRSPPGYLFDLVVVGSGPAGLAAAVCGASEGLQTVSVDGIAIGGQAGTSSRIENYVGFPNGISGSELASLAAVQALRLGARLNAPCRAAGLQPEDGFHIVILDDGSEIPTRSVIIASGARYRRLAVDDLERFEGVGVYYAATDLEARACAGRAVVVVGGGNSAGQAAIHLAQQACEVSLVIRGDDLARHMSRYLIDRIEADARIELCTRTEVRALAGEQSLRSVVLEHTPTGTLRTLPCAGLFCFIGAEPATAWLQDKVALDPDGFVLTDRQLPDSALLASFAGRDPLPFETSVMGVFAVGDVRSGSTKRVAAAVGEGSSVVRSVYDHLAVAP
ncbi:MAG TPA: FAD-dependent oxidoreductase [Acidimicrobiales bacterium]|nr:FAD-dependent oxidoreductase [Acidimicrobiales bacterium]